MASRLASLVEASALPPASRACLAAALRGSPGLKAELRRDPEGFIAGVGRLLDSAAGAIGCAPDAALFVTGFEPSNRAPGRFDAALAELRALCFLRSAGFSGLELLGRQRGKTADIRGRLAGREYFFEVCRVKPGAFGGPGAAAFAALKCDRKGPQVAAAVKRSPGASGGLVLVAGVPGFGRFRADAALSAAARAALEGRSGVPRLLCLLDGDRAGVWPAQGLRS